MCIYIYAEIDTFPCLLIWPNIFDVNMSILTPPNSHAVGPGRPTSQAVSA